MIRFCLCSLHVSDSQTRLVCFDFFHCHFIPTWQYIFKTSFCQRYFPSPDYYALGLSTLLVLLCILSTGFGYAWLQPWGLWKVFSLLPHDFPTRKQNPLLRIRPVRSLTLWADCNSAHGKIFWHRITLKGFSSDWLFFVTDLISAMTDSCYDHYYYCFYWDREMEQCGDSQQRSGSNQSNASLKESYRHWSATNFT